VHLVKEFGWK